MDVASERSCSTPALWSARRLRHPGLGGVPSPLKVIGCLPLPTIPGGGARVALRCPLTSLPVAPLRARRSPPPSPRPAPGTQEELVGNTELVQSYRQQISNVVNQANLQLFWNMYNRCGRRGRLAAPGWEGSHRWGNPDTAVRGRRRVAGRLAGAQTVEPPIGVTSCPGPHPWRGRGRAGLVRSCSTPGIAGRSSGGCGRHPCLHHPEPQG